MLNRRHLRIKVMQAVYAHQRQKPESLQGAKKYLNHSITSTRVLFLSLTQLLIKLHKRAIKETEAGKSKRLATESDLNPSENFISHSIFKMLSESKVMEEALKKRNLNFWDDPGFIRKLFEKIRNDTEYQDFLEKDHPGRKLEIAIAVYIYKKYIAENDGVHQLLEEQDISFMADLPLMNTYMIRFIEGLNPRKTSDIDLPDLLKTEQDMKFAVSLLEKSILKSPELVERIDKLTPNWDKDRIASIDVTLLTMAQCEMLYFPDIPVRVTLNEYVEISKDYSTEKSGRFVNGVLDGLLKHFEKEDMLQKSPTGLM